MNHHGSMQRSSVEVRGYLFYVGDRRKTDLPYRKAPGQKDDWLRLWSGETIVWLAQAADAHYGFNDSS